MSETTKGTFEVWLTEPISQEEKSAETFSTLRSENAELRAALNVVTYADRSRGYPTGKEWNEIVSVVKNALSRHAGCDKEGEG